MKGDAGMVFSLEQIQEMENKDLLPGTPTDYDTVLGVCRCYRMKGDAGMVFSLEQIQDVENKDLLTGHILVLLGQDYDAAQAS